MGTEKKIGRLPPRPDKYADLPPSPVWPSLIEKLLLAIIDANPLENEDWLQPAPSRQARLNKALEALFGVKPQDGRTSFHDLPDLVRIARGRFMSELNRDFSGEVLGLEGAEVPSFPDHVPDNPDDKASKRWRAERLEGKYRAEEFQHYAWWLATFREHEEERDMHRDLVVLQEILRRWNIELRVDPDALALGSLTRG